MSLSEGSSPILYKKIARKARANESRFYFTSASERFDSSKAQIMIAITKIVSISLRPSLFQMQ